MCVLEWMCVCASVSVDVCVTVWMHVMCVLAFVGNCHLPQAFVGCMDFQECVLHM